MARGRILLVDDDDGVRSYTAEILRDAGYAVEAAARVDEAEALLRSGKSIDLLITDIVLPGRDGVALARSLQLTRPDVKVLFTTGYTRHIAPELPRKAEILDKPYHRDRLLHAVGHILSADVPMAGR
jgi:DNA-binding NtrC family response regulator